MHRVVIKTGQALFAKCPKCKQQFSIHANPNKAPLTVAFNHPRQEFKVNCAGCATEFSWTPEELISVPIAAKAD